MTEQEALAKLNAKDWRSLNKNQIMTFLFETAPNLSDEVRLKILESAPDILNTAHTVLSEYQETVLKTLEQNHEITDKILNQNYDIARAVFISYHETLETLKTLLAEPTTPFVEKQYWNSELSKHLREMREYAKENNNFVSDLDKGNKHFSQKIMKYGAIAAGVVVCVAVAAITGSKLELPGK